MRLPRPGFRTWLFLLLLLLGAGLTLLDQRQSEPPGPVPPSRSGEPDYYIEDLRATRYDAQGRPHQQLQAPRLSHTPVDDVTRLQSPTLRLRDDSGRHWTASADRGRLDSGGAPLSLTGNVRLEAPQEHWQLTTRSLHYNADTAHAWSEAPVTLRQAVQRMQAERFDAWLDDNRVRLTDNVRGHHPPATDEDPEP
ncbi:LPS export ABC transporter periplasmic protein LptC [Halomonas sp. 18H]|uniref:LPS export ABC transporter periplasmic protein LptC n=1 Tax=Halomonas almeriensis TaxID=308163 RepID=UPI002231645E|nr:MULTISPECIES: LPS export ABC transporter periplasmic protein LptC [Halomonas]MCW4151626.1 LPS export ABC transporter periplasmic protein LptC [Halomonas sp. 18H]MDN3552763.1 LPS export ABC transporter periplasmic protein LptC [Halomonas almeriensis]